MQISGLPVSTAFGAADVLAIEINGVTYKITGATLAAALQSMGDYVTAQDIANNLTTTDAGYVLDARQGKALLDAIEALGAADVGAVAADQGAANAGKALVVGNDGNVTTGKTVRPDAAQTLTAAEQAQARGNIGAASATELDAEAAAREAADSDLKSAFENNKRGILPYDIIPGEYIGTDGVIVQNQDYYSRTDYTYIGDCSELVAKCTNEFNGNCFYTKDKTFIKYFVVHTTDTKVPVPDNAYYVIFSNLRKALPNLTVSFTTKIQNDIKTLNQELTATNTNLDTVRDAFENDQTPFALAAFTTGKYIDNSGTEQTNVSMSYTSCDLTDDDVGKTIYISGSAWYGIKPFVFVGTSGEIVKSTVPDAGSTYTQYTDLVFIPMESGTLYINRYASGSNVHTARAYYNSVGNLKEKSLADATSYTPVSLGTLIESKLVSAVSGAISDGSNNTQRITDYIEVSGDTCYLITTEMYYGYGLYVWYDADKNYISGKKANVGSTMTPIYCERAKSPSNAAYLVIGYIYQSSFPFPFLMEGKMNSAFPSKRWKGLKWTGIGDSLTQSYAVTGAHYFDLICAATGIEFVNKGVNGTGYAKGTSNFMTRALTVADDSDVVTFFGSGNDASAGLDLGTATDTGTTTIGGCINTAIDNIYSVNPIMNIGLITPTPWQGNMPSDDGFMEGYSNLIVEICKRRSIPCLDLFHCSGLNPNSAVVRTAAYSRDNGGGVHPDENGHALFAPRILAFLDTLLMH